jgi:hypothetical protein
MNKHTTQEILAAYSKGSEHSLEAAAQATYDLGFGAGEEAIKVRMLAGDPELRTEIDERHKTDKVAADAAAHAAKEDEHNRTQARKRELADADQDDAPTSGGSGTAKKPGLSAHKSR